MKKAKDSESVIKALLALRQEAALLVMPGMWRESPGGDLYSYEGGTQRLDDFKEAVAVCEATMIEEGVDP